MNDEKIKVDMKIKKRKNPYILVVLVVLLVATIGYTGTAIYKNMNAEKETQKKVVINDPSGYKKVYTTKDTNHSKDIKKFIRDNKEKKGAYSYQTKGNTYVLLSTGIIEDKKNITIQYEAPVYNKEKDKATVVYSFVPFDAGQESKTADYLLLELDKVETVTTIESNDTIIVK